MGWESRSTVGPGRAGHSGWNSARVLPSGSLNHADLPIPAVVATWPTVLNVGKSSSSNATPGLANNANGARTGITFPGTTQTTTVDASGRPTEIKAVHGATVLSDLTYTYKKGTADTMLVQTRGDKVGVGGPAGSTTGYGYDSLNRLVTATEKTSAGATNASWAYAYDKYWNRTSNTAVLSGVTKTTSQGYNAIDELTSLNGSTAGLSYDADGNSTVNGRDQITAATLGGGAHTTASYLGETQTTMLTANNGSFTTRFGNTMLGLTRQTGNGLTVSFVRTPDGQLIAATTGTSSAYYLTDNLGSTVGIVNSSGVKTAAYAYDPYGRTRTATGSASAANAFRYAGGLYDTTTGATKFGARYYDWGSPRTVDIEGGLPGGLAERMFTWRLQEDHSRRSTGLRPLIG